MVRRLLKGLFKRKIVKRGLIALLIGVLIAGLLGGGIIPLNIGQQPLDFDAFSGSDIIGFHNWQARGALNLDQLLDSIRYITGAEFAAGEKTVAAAQVKFSVSIIQPTCIVGMKYDYFFTSGGTWPDTPTRTWRPTQEQAILPEQWTIIKTDVASTWLPTASGFIRSQFSIHLNSFCGLGNFDLGWQVVVQDDAHVRRGDGEVRFDKTQYEVGETATITYKIGFSASAKTESPSAASGWSFELFSFAQGRAVHSEILAGPNPDGSDGPFRTGLIFYTVQPADFKSGGCAAGATNKLEATLFNNLVFTTGEDATTIDERALGPPAPSITVDKSKYFVGDSLTVQMVAEPNPTTQQPICGMNLHIYYDLGNIELVRIDLSGAAAEYTFNALPDAGIVKIDVFSWDENGRTSVISKAAIAVLDPEGEDQPIDIFWIILLMVVLVVLSIVIWIPMIPIPPAAKLWISILSWGGILGLVIFFFIVPIVVDFFNNLFKLPGLP